MERKPKTGMKKGTHLRNLTIRPVRGGDASAVRGGKKVSKVRE